jgi:hypothetical protein
MMPGGADWSQEIERKLRACDIFVLLVSRHSLSSDYVIDKEIAIIRERQAKGEAVHFYPLVLTPTPKVGLELVCDKNLRPLDGKPLSDYSLNERYRHMNEVVNEIAAIVSRIAGQIETSQTGSVSLPVLRITTNEPIAQPSVHPPKFVLPASESVSHFYGYDRAKRLWGQIRPHEDARQRSLRGWLKSQDKSIALVMASRAALRVLPRITHLRMWSAETQNLFLDVVGTVFRASSFSRAAGKYPSFASEVGRSSMPVSEVLQTFAPKDGLLEVPHYHTVLLAISAARWAVEIASYPGGAPAAESAAWAASAASSAMEDETLGWDQVQSEINSIETAGPIALANSPLWWRAAPDWVAREWTRLRSILPKNESWDVWIDWYEERLRGGSRGEHSELVFTSVPQEEWDKGPATANAWIKAHLPNAAEPTPAELPEVPPAPPLRPPEAPPAELPEALFGLDAPFAYVWTASQRIALVAGAQNLPDYRHFSSEEDHRYALQACRVGCERLLKALRDGRYNARPEYGEALEYYLDDLPKTAGAGNILLANNQARILHDMFLADAAVLSEGLASRLKSVIANQFALNAFYDLVQRHDEAVNAGNWTRPFPLDATRKLLWCGRGQYAAVVRARGRAGAAAGRTGRAASGCTAGASASIRHRAAAAAARDARRARFLAAADGDFGERFVGDVPSRAGPADRQARVARRGGSTRPACPTDPRLPARARGREKVKPTNLHVMPANADIQRFKSVLDARLRGNDKRRRGPLVRPASPATFSRGRRAGTGRFRSQAAA